MRRVSLALALASAVAATGCGGNKKPAADGGAKGTAGVDFSVTVNNTGPGTVVSTPAGIVCAPPVAPAISRTCTATFTSGTAVTLTATASANQYFNGWYGGCSGTGPCKLFVDVDANGNTIAPVTTDADKYVVAYFSASAQAHANWAGGHPATWELNCGICHGKNGEGVGLAPACASCHAATSIFKGVDPTTNKVFAFGKREACGDCHADSGAEHQARYNAYADGINPATTKFAVTNVSLASVANLKADGSPSGTWKSTVTFTLTKGGVPFTADPATLKQKTIYFVSYDATAKKFPTPSYKQTADLDPDGTKGGQNTASVNFSFGSMKAVPAQQGVFTMVKDGLPSDPVATVTNAFLYGYFGDANVPMLEGNLNPGGRHYALMDNMVSFATVLKGTIDYASTATVSGCERCHGAPYSKHGYRQATVAGLNDFVACKACHTDFRRGTDAAWYLPVEIPGYAGAAVTDAQKAQFAYTANVMQDTHNSHAFEFAYPQTMANCTTCHEGKLDLVLTDANFVGTVCKSCHPTTNPNSIAKRAPSFAAEPLKTKLAYHAFNWVDVYDSTTHALVAPAGTIKHTDSTTGAVTYMQCNECHSVDPATGTNRAMYGATVPLFKDIHSGKIASVYAADGSKYSANVTSKIDSATADATAKTVTVVFSMSGLPAGATVKPTVVGSLYGMDTKDFVVGGHGSAADGKRVLEFTAGSTSNNTARLNVTGTGPWTVVANLSDAVAFKAVADGWAKKMEIGFLPAVTLADGTTAIAAGGVSGTIDLATGAQVPNQYGKAIVDTAKCNKCHEALGTEFHSPNYGSAGVVGCRLCHFVGSGSSHFERQSRSIDSFVHAAHSFQKMDLNGPRNGPVTNWADPAVAFEYEEHINSIYPNFSIQNCESCHNPGTYNVPAQNRSLPSFISGSTDGLTGWTDRSITGLKTVVVGPASRACASCHRSNLIKEDDLLGLNQLDSHTAGLGIWKTGADGAAATAADLSTVVQGLIDSGLLVLP